MNQGTAEPPFDMDRPRAAWQEAVFALYLAEGKVEPTSAHRSDTLNAIGLTPLRATTDAVSSGSGLTK